MDFTVESLFFYNKKVKLGNSEMGHTYSPLTGNVGQH